MTPRFITFFPLFCHHSLFSLCHSFETYRANVTTVTAPNVGVWPICGNSQRNMYSCKIYLNIQTVMDFSICGNREIYVYELIITLLNQRC
ncbi:Uncharacterized protein BM_BM528 [Brugia malayi]|uniref:Bm528 n=1 Tax=Brugia malayi TaxID=6279 RepID=A0A0J9XWK1_BRUMA|nr:Uncharacterized protein BM_BM528 [Brugia malayi]CDP97294.1 Bm528 [Brugia malayi]VIO97407.1 Uncharacterized protein BM_BM528 [Brugia malayi]